MAKRSKKRQVWERTLWAIHEDGAVILDSMGSRLPWIFKTRAHAKPFVGRGGRIVKVKQRIEVLG